MAEEMVEEKKKVLLEKAVTYKGVDYAPGINEMPSDAADLIVQKKFGRFVESDAESADFTPLPFEETQQRFTEGDDSDEVFDSLKFYQSKIKAAREAKISVEEFLENEKAGGENQKDSLRLPEDFPMRHVFAKLGEKFNSVEKIQALSEEELINLDGIAEPSAKKILAYGK